MRKWLLRTMAAILAVALIQPAIGTGKVSAEDVTWDAQAPDLDKYEDGQLGYADGDTSFHPGMIYVGYYTEDGKDLTSTGVIRFNLPPRPAGAVIKSATLTVEVKYRSTDPSVIGDPFFKVYGASDDNWTESGTDVPFYDSVANYIGQSGGIPDEDMPPYTFDVKNFLNSEWQGATSAASFVFTGTTAANVNSTISGTDASIGFYDRNAPDQSTHAPKLQIVYAINNPPSDLSLNGNSVAENQPAGTVVGTLNADDTDGDTLTYSITDGDKSDFQIVGDKLQTAASFNYEAKNSYSLKIEAADPYGGAIAEEFTVSVTDVNEAPADITLTNASITENEPSGTAIGQLNGVNDPDQTPGTYSYSIEPGLDGGSFKIDGTELQSNASFNYESKKQYQVNVKVTDGSASFTKTFTIAVTNINEAPTNVTLSKTNIDEGLPAGTEVGTLTGTDPDTSDTLTYSVEGTDKDAFKIVGNSLQSNQTFNFKTKSSYSIQLKIMDAGGLSFTSSPITISVNDVNDTPTSITLSGTSVNENEAIGTTIGTLDAVDPDDSTPYSFDIMSVSGGGAGKFEIDGSVLKTSAIFDYETPPTAYDVEIQVTDAGGAKFKKTFAINVNDVNEAPTGLNLTGTSVDENKPENTVVGTLSAVDPDAGDSLTYKITGGADESSFGIDGDKLVTKGPFDYETAKASYEVKVQATDKGDLTFEKTFTVSVIDVNEEPTGLNLAGTSVDENEPVNTAVGALSAVDPDAGETFSYAIAGGKDASKFQISGSSLQTAAQLDYEAQKSYEVIIQVTDSASNTYEKTFTITVTDINEAPTDISLSPSAVDEGLPDGTTVGTLNATDPDAGDTFQYAIVGTDGNFEIIDDLLKTKVEFDKEDKSSYSIQIKVTDSGNLDYTKTITVTIGDVNEKPTDLTLSDTNVDENQAAGTAVGTLAAVDPDAGDTFMYAIDDAAGTLPFDIAGNSLRTTDVLDYETKNSYDVPVTVTDSGGLTFSKTFSIAVRNVNEAPAASDQSLETRGGRPIDGQLAAIDPENDALTYAIVDQPAKGDLTLDAATGKFTFKPQAGNYEEVTFTFKANDGTLDSNVATVTVTNRQETGGGGGGTPPKKPDVSVDDIGGAGGVIASFDDEDSNRLHISFDRNALQNLPADMKTFTLHLNDQLESVDIAIDPWLFDQLSERDIVLTVQTSLGVLSLPKSAWALAGEDTLTVTLESAPSAATKGLHVVGKPVSVQLKKDGAPITAPLDTGFLTLQLPVSGNRPTTAVRLLANGGYQPVPSLIVKDDGGYSVQVSSRAGGTFALVSETAHFSDTSGWSQPYIDELASRLIVNGVGGDKFEPNRGVTRAEFAKIVVQALDLISGTPTGGFKDTDPTAWYADSVGTAVQLGLFSGYPDGTFHPAQAISRQEAFAVLSRALKLADVDSVFSDADRAEALGSFSDSANMQDWAQEALAASQLLGLVHDDGTEFHPTAPMTREQLCFSVVQLLRAGGLIEQD